jgi:hypothetical protein
VLRLEDLAKIFGGEIRTFEERTWLDTHIGGLRAFVVRRVTANHSVTFDLAVFTKHTRELDPFFARESWHHWAVKDDEIPRLEHNFVFVGCDRGILFARNTGEPSLEGLVSTLWLMAEWARKPWRVVNYAETSRFKWSEWPEWLRVAVTFLIMLLVFWLLLG